jgi:Tfp pilus assembly protein PilF
MVSAMKMLRLSACLAFLLAPPALAQAPNALGLCGNPAEPPERAERWCTQALSGRLTPRQEALAALNLGLARLQLEDFARAEEAFDRALRADPAEARALGGRAQAREAQGKLPAAAVDWNAALALDPRDAGLLAGRGAFRLRAGNPGGAAADFEAAARLEPRETRHRFNLGLALAELGRDAEAERAFSQVIAADPADAGAWLNRARLRAVPNPTQALADFDQAVARGGEWSVPWFERGVLKDSMGRKAEADQDFRRAWELGHRSEFLTERIRAMGQ